MSCRRIREKFARYGKQELSTEEAKIVAAHLAACQRCRTEYRLFDLKHQLLLSTLPEEGAELSPYFYSRLAARLGEMACFPTPALWETVRVFSRAFALVAFILLAVMVGVNIYIRVSMPVERFDFVNSLAERNLSEGERTIFSEENDLSSEKVLGALISEGGRR